ncbi:unnamed protein product, partial [Meganyctiphanes norvegica]
MPDSNPTVASHEKVLARSQLPKCSTVTKRLICKLNLQTVDLIKNYSKLRWAPFEGYVEPSAILVPQFTCTLAYETFYGLSRKYSEFVHCRTFQRDETETVYRGHSGLVRRIAWRPDEDSSAKIFLFE